VIAKPSAPLIAFRASPDLLEAIDRRVRTKFVSRSDAIRTLLWKQIEKEDREEAEAA
jgi:metal-responsive CopG/Arc/MetJ family transcriptional regulator